MDWLWGRSKFLNLAMPRCPHLCNGDANSLYASGLSEIKSYHARHLEQFLAHSKPSVGVGKYCYDKDREPKDPHCGRLNK